MAEETRKDAYTSLLDMGRVFLQQATTVQRSALEYCRQFADAEDAGRSLRTYHEELMRKTLDALDPFFVLEQSTRQQVLQVQTAVFEVLDGALRRPPRSR
jgi:hypothetical protein